MSLDRDDAEEGERDCAVAIPVTDLERAEHFYSNILCLEQAFSAPNVIAYSLGETRMLLTLRPGYVAPDEAGILIYLGIADLERAHERLVRDGARDGGAPHVVARMGDREIWIALILDPFGNTPGLIEERPTPSASEPAEPLTNR